MSTLEELREALLELEKSRSRERQQRRMAEALLAGLRVLVLTNDPNELFRQLFDVMREPLEFDTAMVLLLGEDGTTRPVACSDPLFVHTVWPLKAMLRRVLSGQAVAVFDTWQVEEWRAQPAEVHERVRSALHFSIPTSEQRAVFVCTHGERAHFSRNHVILARRFSFLAMQALQKVESEARVADLEQRLRNEARVAELNRRLAESERKLARAQKMEAMGMLAGGVAHDLNNILSGLVGYPDLLLLDGGLSAEQRAAIQTIKDSGVRAAAIVQDLLTVARGVASNREPVSLNQVVEDYFSSPEHHDLVRAHRRLEIRTDTDPELLNIPASRVHVGKALTNLVSNAAEAIAGQPRGRVTIATENRYVDRPLSGYEEVCAGEYAVLRVRDNGLGISPTDLERIFEPFYAKKTMGRSGTGLGLTIVWNTVQDHGGYVDVASGGEGTDFALYFPVTRESLADERASELAERYRGAGQRVLVIDDLPDQRCLACAMLRKLGYSAEAVASGEEALAYVEQHPVDILVLDMIMDPGIGGRETYERISSLRRGQKAVLVSGYSMTEDVSAAQAAGAGQYLKKPYTLEQFGIAVRDELAR
ncbi:ATP-binding protein [Planctomycetota bacterium]